MIDQVLICIFAPLVEVPSAILPATVARIAKKAGFALLAACLPVVAHGQSYTYADAAQLLAQTDALGRRTAYAYDAAGRRTQRRFANGGQEGSAWNAEGQLISQTHLDGSQSTYSYQQGRLIGQTRADGHLAIGHDRHGRANHYSDSQRGLLTLALDPLGRQASETTARGPTRSQTQTQWDAASQRSQLSAHFENHSPHTIKATWDAGGRLQSLKANTNPSGPITRLTHDAAGRLTQMQRANGSTSHWRYSADGHLIEIHHQSASGQTLARYRYERDAKGRLTQASEQTAGQSETIKTWQYDADGKLTRESTQQAGQSRTCTYQHDRVGNRTEKDCDGHKTSYSYNELDQLTQESSPSHTITYRWDARGNLIEKQTPQQTTHYRWSADNRLTEVQSGNTRVSYGYDALGRRISRTWQSGNHTWETQWVLDTARPYSEIVLERTRQNGGAWKERAYVHTPDGVGLQISESEEGQTRHIYTDAQGSTRLITDEAGNVLQTLDYDAFGNEQTSGPTRHRYTGESFDSATGLYHLRARDYDPSTGRFISMDEHPGSRTIPLTLNKYLYGNADPVNHIDPSGNFGLVGVSMGGNIQATLANLQANFGFDLISNALDGGQSSASSTGWAVLASLAPMSIAKLSKGAIRVTSRMGKGKVAYLSKRKPLIHEIETAEFIADRKMVGIYLVGGNSSAGADAFINGLRWELKRINGTPSSVKSNIDKAIKQMEKSNPGTPVRVVLDRRAGGASSGLTMQSFTDGIMKVQASRRDRITEIMYILGDGSIHIWP